MGHIPLEMVAQKMFTGVDSFPYMAIPFFILAGDIMAKGSLSTRLLNFGNILVGWIRGGIGLAGVVASMIFGGITGSGIADCSALAPVEIPMMVESGYDKKYATGLVCAAACCGPIIPPSIPMVIYACATGLSIGAMFAAGMVPGILIGLVLMGLAYIISCKRHYPRRMEKLTAKLALTTFIKAIPVLLLPVIILGGILFGICTPTEAAAISVAYAFILSVFVYRDVKLADFPKMLANTAMVSGVVLILASTSNIFGQLVTLNQVGPILVSYFGGFNKIMFLFMVNILLLFLGCFLDNAPVILILGPLLAPLAIHLGINPLHFGTVFIVNMVIGLITPPLGQILFVAVPISKLSLEDVAKGTFPFLVSEVAVLFLITYVPAIVMWLPKLLGYA
jgi:C4-dicarboxylate transporter DctM subunit